MKDNKGLYYYPFISNKKVRVYVRNGHDDIEFRLWNQDDPGMWEQHGWAPYAAIEQAMSMYKGGGFDPKTTYDLSLARSLLKDAC
ncbi:MAG: hypothetical protein GY874_19360 [Desulfobacteraceae bacterium]|nr:hypothetical protein [Desulfobacteraceae bacterium]